jgi:hypothetical protein
MLSHLILSIYLHCVESVILRWANMLLQLEHKLIISIGSRYTTMILSATN